MGRIKRAMCDEGALTRALQRCRPRRRARERSAEGVNIDAGMYELRRRFFFAMSRRGFRRQPSGDAGDEEPDVVDSNSASKMSTDVVMLDMGGV